MLGREFFQRRADRRGQRVVLFEQKNIMLRHIRICRFTTRRHLDKTSEFLEYDKAKELVKGKQGQFAYPPSPANFPSMPVRLGPIRSGALRSDPGWQHDTLGKGRIRSRSPSKPPAPRSPSRKEKSDRPSTRRLANRRQRFQE